MRLIPILLIVCLIIISACSNEQRGEEKMVIGELPQPVDVNINTKDDVSLKGTFYPADSSKGIIMLHQFSKDRTSYQPLISELEGFNILAIDLRGHGKSSLDYNDFNDEDFVAMKNDAQAATEFMKRKGISEKHISYVGASIGANTVQNFVSENDFDNVVLLSPGLTYKGIDLNLNDDGALVVVSEGDVYSYDSVKELQKSSKSSEFIFRQGNQHGTNMFDAELISRIKEFLR